MKVVKCKCNEQSAALKEKYKKYKNKVKQLAVKLEKKEEIIKDLKKRLEVKE